MATSLPLRGRRGRCLELAIPYFLLAGCREAPEAKYTATVLLLSDSVVLNTRAIDSVEAALFHRQFYTQSPDSTAIWTEAAAPTLLRVRNRVDELVGDFALTPVPPTLDPINKELVAALDDLKETSGTTYEAIACFGYGCKTVDWDILAQSNKRRRWALVAYKKARDRLTRFVKRQGIEVPPNPVLDSLVASAPESKL